MIEGENGKAKGWVSGTIRRSGENTVRAEFTVEVSGEAPQCEETFPGMKIYRCVLPAKGNCYGDSFHLLFGVHMSQQGNSTVMWKVTE